VTLTISRKALSVVIAVIAAVILAVTISACSGVGGQAAENAQQQTDTSNLVQNQPLPEFTTSAYRQELIEIEAIEALGAPTTAFFFPVGTTVVTQGGKQVFSSPPIKVCPAEGEPIPNTASLSNPQQVVSAPNTSSAVISQMDPNGVYVPQNSSGTNVLCDNPNGGQKLSYWEGPVFDESGTAVWSDTQGIVDVGSTALPACVIQSHQNSDGTTTSYYHCTLNGKSANSVPTKTKADYVPAS
jgi:hypothetical protein